MSHFTTVQTEIRDLECLKKALDSLNYAWQEGPNLTIPDYYGQHLPVDIKVTGLHREVGYQKQGDAYALEGDWWGMEQKQEEFHMAVTQKYSYYKVMKEIEPLLQEGFVFYQQKVEQQIEICMQRS